MVAPKQPAPSVEPAQAASLSPGVRRHLGQSLRSAYATLPTAPASQRLEALIAQLDKPKR